MSKDFPLLVGRFIHYCGLIEFYVNNSIRAFSKDEILLAIAVKMPLIQRIELLKKLLKERSEINHKEIDSLCKDLDSLRMKRNIVAHNPILSKSPDESSPKEIIAVRYRPVGNHDLSTISEDDISDLVSKSREIMIKIYELIPESRKT